MHTHMQMHMHMHTHEPQDIAWLLFHPKLSMYAGCSADLLMMDTPPPNQAKLNKTPRTGPRVTFASPKSKDLLTHSPYVMAVSHCRACRQDCVLALILYTYMLFVV